MKLIFKVRNDQFSDDPVFRSSVLGTFLASEIGTFCTEFGWQMKTKHFRIYKYGYGHFIFVFEHNVWTSDAIPNPNHLKTQLLIMFKCSGFSNGRALAIAIQWGSEIRPSLDFEWSRF